VEAVGKGSASCERSGGGSEAMGTAKWRQPWSKCGRHGQHRWSYRAADGWALAVSDFSNLSKTSSILKIKMGALSCSKNSEFSHAANRQYWKQLAQLCQLQIPNRNKVKNPIIDSVFESLMNFKRDSNLREKSDKLSNIPS
jgi:hypothetical protein